MNTLSAGFRLSASNVLFPCMLAILACILVSAVPLSASSQTLRGTTFVTESGDHTVIWNDNWSASLTDEDDFSTMVMLEGQIMIYAVMFIHDADLALSPKAVYYSLSGVVTSSFDSDPTQSTEWSSDGSWHGAHLVRTEGIDFVLYMRVDPATADTGPTMQFAAAPVSAFSVSLAAMQDELQIDGEPALVGETGDEILSRMQEDSPEDSSDGEATVSEYPVAPAATDSKGVRSPHGEIRSQDTLVEADSPARSQYLSSSTGFSVNYPDMWTDMAEVNRTVGEFSLVSSSGRIMVSFTGRSTTETNREAFFAEIVARESRYSSYVDSVMSEDRLLVATWTGDNELAVLEYVFLNNSVIVTVVVTITATNPDLYIDDIQGIELDGIPILKNWDQIDLD